MINAIICEFNPFHNGHKYLIDTSKSLTGADGTVCFMSGNFVQRGDAAFCDSHYRAHAAVKCGADVVLQIPTAYTLAGASVFASAGVQMANALGIPATLCFGSESADITPLFRLALTDSEKLKREFKNAINDGKSYAAAVTQAYGRCSDINPEILKNPNDLLAFEYIKAIIETKSTVRVRNIPRRGAAHDGGPIGEIASASYIRAHAGLEDTDRYMPYPAHDMIDRKKFENAVLFSIYCKSEKELVQYAYMSEGLNNRFYNAARNAQTLDELITAVKSRRYTHARIRRAAMCAFAGIPAGLYKTPVPYLKVLAFNSRGREILNDISANGSLPLITRPKTAADISPEHFGVECRSADLYDFCSKARRGGGREYVTSPIYVR